MDKLVRYQRNLRVLLNNFVNFAGFFRRKSKAVFQNGTMFMDGRSFDLVVRVNDAARHSALAGLSRACLLYCQCVRPGTKEVCTVLAAVTAGHTGNLMEGRNGIYYDRAGRDWGRDHHQDVLNPISVSEAFFSPYRLAQMVSEQARKMASTMDKTTQDQSRAGLAIG